MTPNEIKAKRELINKQRARLKPYVANLNSQSHYYEKKQDIEILQKIREQLENIKALDDKLKRESIRLCNEYEINELIKDIQNIVWRENNF